jgi:hypothetical protein
MTHYVCAYLVRNATGIYYLTLTGITLINFYRSFNVYPSVSALGIFLLGLNHSKAHQPHTQLMPKLPRRTRLVHIVLSLKCI